MQSKQLGLFAVSFFIITAASNAYAAGPVCWKELSKIAMPGNTVEQQLAFLGEFSSSEVRLADGLYYSVRIDADKSLRLVTVRRDESSKLDKPALEFSHYPEISLARNLPIFNDLTQNKTTLVFLGDHIFLLAQKATGQNTAVYEINLAKRQISRPDNITNRTNIDGELPYFTSVIPREAGGADYVYQVKENLPGQGINNSVYSKTLTLATRITEGIIAGGDRLLHTSPISYGKMHTMREELVEIKDGKTEKYYKYLVAHLTDSFKTSDQLTFQIFETTPRNVKVLDVIDRTGSKLVKTIKILEKITDLKSTRILKDQNSQLHLLIEANEKYFTAPFNGGNILTASKGDVSLASYMRNFEVVSEEVFSQKSANNQKYNVWGQNHKPVSESMVPKKTTLVPLAIDSKKNKKEISFPITSEQIEALRGTTEKLNGTSN